MTHLFINAASASAGGGLTYIQNIVPQIAKREDISATILLEPIFARSLPHAANITLLQSSTYSNTALRFFAEQRLVPALVLKRRPDALICTGNFAIANSPVPQILLSRNSLYTSRDFQADLRSRGEHRLWLNTQIKGALARWSIRQADVVIAPSQAFADELRRWSGVPVVALHHGFDREFFVRDESPLGRDQQAKLDSAAGAFRILFVSHYNYYRNFETLLKAMPLIKKRLAPRRVALFLTCDLEAPMNGGGYRSNSALNAIRELALADSVIQLGTVDYRHLHHLYASADCYVNPAYAESFAHPLVEAMSSSLPIVASNLAVHKEICAEAALYFDRFSPEELGQEISEIALDPQTAKRLGAAGAKRYKDFSWQGHLQRLVELAESLARTSKGESSRTPDPK
jgi:glycosyltransferase involved in cell wall biosynthesis